jgi:hypothetical protein
MTAAGVPADPDDWPALISRYRGRYESLCDDERIIRARLSELEAERDDLIAEAWVECGTQATAARILGVPIHRITSAANRNWRRGEGLL